MIKFLAYILLIIVPISGFAGTTHPSINDTKYLDYGSQFICVGKICGVEKNDTMFCASCVAINDHWILTAAHVVHNARSCVVFFNDRSFEISDIYVHKDFNSKFGLYDIALLYTEKAIGLDFYPKLYSEEDEVGKVCSIAGYGFHGTFITGSKSHDDKKRAGSNIIDNISEHLLICSADKSNQTQLEFLIASGDSGGGLFIDQKLAGINSCVLAADKNPNSDYGDESGHTRISINKEWIQEIIDEKK